MKVTYMSRDAKTKFNEYMGLTSIKKHGINIWYYRGDAMTPIDINNENEIKGTYNMWSKWLPKYGIFLSIEKQNNVYIGRVKIKKLKLIRKFIHPHIHNMRVKILFYAFSYIYKKEKYILEDIYHPI